MGVKQEIEITIGKNGEVQIHVQGVDGPQCLEFSKFLEDSLGTAVKTEKTSEYYKEKQKAEVNIKPESRGGF